MYEDKRWDHLIQEGTTQPVFDYGDSVLEKVYVETTVDTDGDGKLDLVAVYIRRPKETLEGLKVPAVYVASPYIMHCNEDWYVPHSVNQELKEFEEQSIPWEAVAYDFSQEVCLEPRFPRKTTGFAEFSPVEQPDFEAISDVYSYFVSRGYAAVFCGGLGTRDSQGFTLTGSRQEILAFRAVIDWMCGRARAFTNQEDNLERRADWCTGKVAMTGKSYLGTMCIGVAMTGVKGLETIIPEAAISNWYEYYRSNGLVVPALEWQGDDLDILAKYCFSRALDPADYETVKDDYWRELEKLVAGQDRDSGNYNRFWDERNYLNQIASMKASALIIHGINDWNVKMDQCTHLWNAMKAQGLLAKMVLHQGDHIYIYHMKDSPALKLVHQWLDYHLYGLENGAVAEDDRVWVQSALAPSKWMTFSSFPPEETTSVIFPIDEDTAICGKGQRPWCFWDDLEAAGYHRERDNQQQWLEGLVLPEGQGKPHCSSYLWDPFVSGQAGFGKDHLRISGQIEVNFTCSLNRGTAILSAMLVEYGNERRLTVRQSPSGAGKSSWGTGTPEFEEMIFEREAEPSAYRVISRGHMNAQNRENNWSKCELLAGKEYSYRLPMVSTDYLVEKGKKLGFILYGADPTQTLRPDNITQVTLKENSIFVKIPGFFE